MGAKGQERGWDIGFDDNGVFCYLDTLEPVAGNRRCCGKCGKDETKEGHDGCIGTLKGVMNACCGHGEYELAYVQFWNDERIAGKEALNYIEKNREI